MVAMAIPIGGYIRRQELEGEIQEKRNNTDGKHTARLCLEVKQIAGCSNLYTMSCVSNNIDLLQIKRDGRHCADHAAPSPRCHVFEPIYYSPVRLE